MKRRSVLLAGAGAAGALVVGWAAMPVRQRLRTSAPLPLDPGQSALNGWVEIGSDNRVHVVMCKSEMGQGVHTGLAMVLAEELDAPWPSVRIKMSPIDGIYNNLAAVVDGLPFHPDDDGLLKSLSGWLTAKSMREIGVMMTGGSSSLKDLWAPMRQAGASARAMLIQAAAHQWQLQASDCTAAQGKVSHPSGRSATYGELSAAAAQLPLPDAPALKDPAHYTLVGQPLRRLEAAAKLDGSARFGLDVLPPGLLYASVVMCPTLGGAVGGWDGAAASRMRGVHHVLSVPGLAGGTAGVAVIADAPHRAQRAVQAVSVQWVDGAAAQVSSDDILSSLSKTLDSDAGFAFYRHGDVDAALASAARVVTAEYRAPYLAHAAMEPINCTVLFKDGRATVWASTQVPGIARQAVATVLGIAAQDVDVQVQFVGGGFGRRLDADYIAQAAFIARQAPGRPVQTL